MKVDNMAGDSNQIQESRTFENTTGKGNVARIEITRAVHPYHENGGVHFVQVRSVFHDGTKQTTFGKYFVIVCDAQEAFDGFVKQCEGLVK